MFVKAFLVYLVHFMKYWIDTAQILIAMYEDPYSDIYDLSVSRNFSTQKRILN